MITNFYNLFIFMVTHMFNLVDCFYQLSITTDHTISIKEVENGREVYVSPEENTAKTYKELTACIEEVDRRVSQSTFRLGQITPRELNKLNQFFENLQKQVGAQFSKGVAEKGMRQNERMKVLVQETLLKNEAKLSAEVSLIARMTHLSTDISTVISEYAQSEADFVKEVAPVMEFEVNDLLTQLFNVATSQVDLPILRKIQSRLLESTGILIGNFIRDAEGNVAALSTLTKIGPALRACFTDEFRASVASLNLDRIALSQAQIEGITSFFPNLLYLSLSECGSTSELLQSLAASCPHLRSLHLGRNGKLVDESLEHLKKFKNLAELNLAHCPKITNKGIQYLQGLECLTTLNLQGAVCISDRGIACLVLCKKLTHLNLTDCLQLTSESVQHLKNIKGLTTLSLKGCLQITSAGFLELVQYPNLTHIDLSNCPLLNAATIQAFHRCTRLQVLDLTGNSIKESAKKSLKAALPHLTVLD
ncbi:MAG: hypothetical protein JWO53_1109 [Chlamydiia bacterium]|nr:hypothetical protein [Chlamydiia bacterium]